ncbi:ABC transporter ATP-binding protein [Falsirhodobacter xinxiangensis]|uniref:ABC transporter ATP-binding protein n=1 Tax=Falsirhodobacter xinxiangensis TaxID=2530049 RepID=UPI0010AABDFD|nr:ABC transporter ATP-binding protein [Rhodobacter xinxiangensis]
MTLLKIENLGVRFGDHDAVAGLDLSLAKGEAVALVGESGCGKSTTALSVMRLLPPAARLRGRVLLDGTDLLSLSEPQMRRVRGNRISMIFQEPMTSLNPVHSIGAQIVEAIRQHADIDKPAARKRALELLDMVHMPDSARRIDDFPHEFSGGQRQRVMIAMAIASRPELMIADEPTTALDATIQHQILSLLDELRRELGMGLLLISHDLSVVSRWTDRAVIMHHGQHMEELAAKDLFTSGHHPYTRGLVSASLRLDRDQHYRSSRLPEIRVTRDAGDYAFSVVRRPAPVAAVPDDGIALRTHDLTVTYKTARGPVTALDGVSVAIPKGGTLGLVGESGSGKSTLARALTQLVTATSGRIELDGQDVTHPRGAALRDLRRRVQMVFQDPYASLNPRHSVGYILETPLAVHDGLGSAERAKKVRQVLDQVGLPAAAADRMPHEFSGGQRQRIGIARALVMRPSVLICDEPVSALDVSVQATILNLLSDLKAELGFSCLFISHDLAVVQFVSDRVVVMRNARVVEENDHLSIWRRPQTDYTRGLIAAASG